MLFPQRVEEVCAFALIFYGSIVYTQHCKQDLPEWFPVNYTMLCFVVLCREVERCYRENMQGHMFGLTTIP